MKTMGVGMQDSAGFELKEYVRGWLEAKGWAYKDFGTNSTASVDRDYAHPLACSGIGRNIMPVSPTESI